MQWAYSYDEENFHDKFDSKDEAVLAGFLNDPEVESIWVGQFEPYGKGRLVKELGGFDGKRIVEHCIESMADDMPESVYENYGDHLLKDEICSKVNNFLADLILGVEPPDWFWIESGTVERVSKEGWLAEGNQLD